ncbi:MAG TPA: hypothetical protein VLD62_03750 [Acidimicrobiia bacterium]|nr:hypothetical protein [Acidimicrobiia bacterium]
MRPSILLVAASVVTASLVWSVRLALDPDPFASDAAGVIAVASTALAVVAVTGMLVARGRWSRRLAGGLVALWLGLAATMPLDGLGVAGLAAAGVAAAALAGPWLGGWIRLLPSANGPEPLVVAVVLGILALPVAVALALHDGLSTAAWVLAGGAVAIGWLVSRASLAGLWGARAGLPALGVWVAVTGDLPGAAIAGGLGVVAGAATWAKPVRLAVDPLAPPPVERVPFPPELVPPGILEAAGYDDRGVPREEAE